MTMHFYLVKFIAVEIIQSIMGISQLLNYLHSNFMMRFYTTDQKLLFCGVRLAYAVFIRRFQALQIFPPPLFLLEFS